MNVAELSIKNLNAGEHTSIVFEGKEYTNKQMDQAANRLGNALKKMGIQPGDRVIMQMPNCPEVFQAFQAIWKIGAIAVPINYMVGMEETAFIYQNSGSKIVISSPEYLDKINAAKSSSLELKDVIMVSSDPVEGTLSFYDLLAENDDELEMIETADDDVAVLIYTSGTTGNPKGVMLTHSGLSFTANSIQDTCNFPEDLVSLAVLPLCHSFGLGLMNGAFLRLKGKTVILPSFDLEKLFSSIEKYKINSVAAVPTMYVYMLLFPDGEKYDLSSVKYWVSGSAPLTQDTWNQFKKKFGGEIADGWGLTECGANNSSNIHLPVKKVGTIGKPLNGMEMKIFNENDQELPQGEEGEIVIRGPMVMKGYWNLPEETEKTLKNGWLHTGDVGYIDPDGYFVITDRKKDIIIKGGENISPRTIEEVLFAHPKVAEAAVIGINDPVYGEDIKAFVTLKPDNTATTDEIMAFCKENLKKFRVPKEIAIVEALPKNLVGKILKKELRKQSAE